MNGGRVGVECGWARWDETVWGGIAWRRNMVSDGEWWMVVWDGSDLMQSEPYLAAFKLNAQQRELDGM